MYQGFKISLFSLAFLAILPLVAMQSEDVPEWRRGPKPQLKPNSPSFGRRRSLSNEDRRLNISAKKLQGILKDMPFKKDELKPDPKIFTQSVSEPSSPASSRQAYSREVLLAFAEAHKKAPNKMIDIKVLL